MKHHFRLHGDGSRCADLVRDLAIPVPFELGEFRACLEQRTQRAAVLIPADLGGASGTLLRTAGADYLCYEQQTSPFHQAHIVLSLAAQLLLGGSGCRVVDRRLMPDLSPQLIRLMLGDTACSTVTHAEAETFAILALDAADAAGCPPLLARRVLRQLGPLHAALREVVPPAANAVVVDGARPGARFRLHQRVIEIRDAVVALGPYRAAEMASAATRVAQAAGLNGDRLAASVEAAVLAGAIGDRKAGSPALRPAGYTGRQTVPGSGLRSEAEWLAKVSLALARLGLDADQRAARLPGSSRTARR